jgi:ABC-type Fe3+-siderophore transport system permease subunit
VSHLLVTAGALLGLGLLYRMARLNTQTRPVAAACIVVASSVYTVLTADRTGLDFKVHLWLLAGVALVVLLRAFRHPRH